MASGGWRSGCGLQVAPPRLGQVRRLGDHALAIQVPAMPSSEPMVMTLCRPRPPPQCPRPRRHGQHGFGNVGQRREVALSFLGFFSWPPSTVTKLGRSLHARVVLVAGALVDAALAAEFGLHRLHRQAVGLHRAVAATLAHQLVDDHRLVGRGQLAALAAAALSVAQVWS